MADGSREKFLTYIELLLLFLLCAIPPIAYERAVGADEQFYLVKTALVEGLVLLLLAARLAGCALGIRTALPRPPIVFIALAAWLAASVFIAHNRHEAAHAAVYILCLPALYYVAATSPDRSGLRATVTAGTLCGAAAAALYGILDFANLTGPALFLDWGDRTASFFSDPNYFGIYLVVPLMVCAGLLLFGSMKKTSRALVAVLCALLFMALVLSNSRSAWAATMIAAVVFAAAALAGPRGAGGRLARASYMFALFAALAVSAAAVTSAPFMKKYNFNLPARIKSIPAFPRYEADPRLLLWKSSRDMVAKKPLTGFGIGSFYLEYHPYQLAYKGSKGFPPDPIVHSRHAYNDYLEMAAETGLPGLALWLGAVALMLAAGASGAMRAGPFAQAAFAGCAAYMLAGLFFQHPLHNAAGAAVAFVWLGAVSGNQMISARAPGAPARVAAGIAAAALAAAAFVYVPLPVRGYKLFNAAGKDLAKGRAAEAARKAEAAIAVDPGKPFPRLAAAQARLGTAKDDPAAYEKAEAHLNVFTAMLPADAASREMLGALYKRRGRYSDALAQYALAEKYSYGDTTSLRFEEAAVLMSSFRFREAGDKFAALAAEAEKKARVEDLYAEMNHIRERLEKSGMDVSVLTAEDIAHVKAYRAALAQLARALFMRGVCLQQDGDVKASLQPLKRAADLEPSNRQYKSRLAAACIGLDAPECKQADPPPADAAGHANDVTFH